MSNEGAVFQQYHHCHVVKIVYQERYIGKREQGSKGKVNVDVSTMKKATTYHVH